MHNNLRLLLIALASVFPLIVARPHRLRSTSSSNRLTPCQRALSRASDAVHTLLSFHASVSSSFACWLLYPSLSHVLSDLHLKPNPSSTHPPQQARAEPSDASPWPRSTLDWDKDTPAPPARSSAHSADSIEVEDVNVTAPAMPRASASLRDEDVLRTGREFQPGAYQDRGAPSMRQTEERREDAYSGFAHPQSDHLRSYTAQGERGEDMVGAHTNTGVGGKFAFSSSAEQLLGGAKSAASASLGPNHGASLRARTLPARNANAHSLSTYRDYAAPETQTHPGRAGTDALESVGARARIGASSMRCVCLVSFCVCAR